MFGAFLVTFGGRFGALLESWGVSGLLLGDFGHRLASTWGPWVQLGRLGLPFWSQKLIFDWFLVDLDPPISQKSSKLVFQVLMDLPIWPKTSKLVFQVLISLVSKPVFQVSIQSSNRNMSISLCRSVVLHGCGGLREAVSMRGGLPLAWWNFHPRVS